MLGKNKRRNVMSRFHITNATNNPKKIINKMYEKAYDLSEKDLVTYLADAESYIENRRKSPGNKKEIIADHGSVETWLQLLDQEYQLFKEFWSYRSEFGINKKPFFNYNIRLILRYITYHIHKHRNEGNLLKNLEDYVKYIKFKAITSVNDILIHSHLDYIQNNISYIAGLKGLELIDVATQENILQLDFGYYIINKNNQGKNILDWHCELKYLMATLYLCDSEVFSGESTDFYKYKKAKKHILFKNKKLKKRSFTSWFSRLRRANDTTKTEIDALCEVKTDKYIEAFRIIKELFAQ
jgi:hypothetical protein